MLVPFSEVKEDAYYRALIVDVYGPDTDKEWNGKPIREAIKVVFDRSGLNSAVFRGRTNTEAFRVAVSSALAAAIDKHGPDWTKDYTVTGMTY